MSLSPSPVLVKCCSILAIPVFVGILVTMLARLSYVRLKKRHEANGYDISKMSHPSYLRIFVTATACMCVVMWVVRKMKTAALASPSPPPPNRGGGIMTESDRIVNDMLNYIDRSDAPF